MLVDTELAQALHGEFKRAATMLDLVASDNHASSSILELQGGILTDRAVEGYAGNRYFPGCEWIDVIEGLAIERAKRLFDVEYVNVQPHSGTSANLAVYLALLKPGDTVMSMELAHGGHLSHGYRKSFCGRLFRCVSYGVDRNTELINYDELMDLACRERPNLLIAGGSAYPRAMDFERLRQIADSSGALLLVDMAHFVGLVAGGYYPSPVPHAHVVTGTTYKTLKGGRGGFILGQRQFAAAIDSAVFPGIQGSVHVPSLAAKAYAFGVALTDEFREYAGRVVSNARALATGLMEQGARLVTGGTDSHLLLLDLKPYGLTGIEAEKLLYEVGILCNRNKIPFDETSPSVGGGIRLATSGMTARGMGEREMEQVAGLITNTLAGSVPQRAIKDEVYQLCLRFPLRIDGADMGLLNR